MTSHKPTWSYATVFSELEAPPVQAQESPLTPGAWWSSEPQGGEPLDLVHAIDGLLGALATRR
jgi:hypothetical protein